MGKSGSYFQTKYQCCSIFQFEHRTLSLHNPAIPTLNHLQTPAFLAPCHCIYTYSFENRVSMPYCLFPPSSPQKDNTPPAGGASCVSSRTRPRIYVTLKQVRGKLCKLSKNTSMLAVSLLTTACRGERINIQITAF